MAVRRMWRGEIALGRAFWVHMLLAGTLANLLATIAALSTIALGGQTWAAFLIAKAPTPYFLLATVSVWRSADRHAGPPWLNDLVKAAAILWLAAVLVF